MFFWNSSYFKNAACSYKSLASIRIFDLKKKKTKYYFCKEKFNKSSKEN